MAVKKDTPPTKYYEVVERGNSGFIMDGTKGTIYEQQLKVPAIRWIPTQGRTAIDGEQGSKVYKDIRYLSGSNIIDKEAQEKLGQLPNKLEDKIGIENGFMTVIRDGNTIALYDYLEKSFYNLDNPDRPDSATAIYREVKLDKKAVDLLDEDEMLTQAKSLVYQLRLETGDKKNRYKYNTDRIDAICRLVNVWDETPERKLILLLQTASQNPKLFLETVVKAERTVITEVSHSLELGVISFDKNVAQFVDGNEIIFTVEGDKLKQEQKIEQLASFFSTEEGNAGLTKMRTKLEIAKDKSLKA